MENNDEIDEVKVKTVEQVQEKLDKYAEHIPL